MKRSLAGIMAVVLVVLGVIFFREFGQVNNIPLETPKNAAEISPSPTASILEQSLVVSTLPEKKAAEKVLFPIKQNGKYGYIDASGKLVVEAQFEDANPFKEGVALIKQNGKYGYLDGTGKVVIESQFEHANDFSEGRALVSLDKKKMGYIDYTGKVVIPLQYRNGGNFSDGLAPVATDVIYSFIDQSGKEILPEKYVYVSGFSEGYVSVADGLGSVSYINKQGQAVLEVESPPMDTEIFPCTSFINGLAFVKQKDDKGEFKWVLINTEWKQVGTLRFDRVSDFSENLAAVQIDGKWGMINTEGGLVIKPNYDFIERMSEGLTPVESGKKWGYMNGDGELIIDYKFDTANPFSHGLAKVGEGNKRGYINKKGEYVWKPTE